jgi:hypothetical protein
MYTDRRLENYAAKWMEAEADDCGLKEVLIN